MRVTSQITVSDRDVIDAWDSCLSLSSLIIIIGKNCVKSGSSVGIGVGVFVAVGKGVCVDVGVLDAVGV